MKILHITNGEYSLQHYKKQFKLDKLICFNEAMAWGSVDKVVFSNGFIENRIKSLKISKQEYFKNTLSLIDEIEINKFDEIRLYFGKDMFCQINLITIIAYLAQIHCHLDVIVNIIDDYNYNVLTSYIANVADFKELYDKIVVNKTRTKTIYPYIDDSISMYLSYMDNNSPINTYIRKNIDSINLINELISRFHMYGLGDRQYSEMININKNKLIKE